MSEKKYKVTILNKDGSPKTTMMNYIESHYSTTVLLDPQKLPKKGSVLKVKYDGLPDYLTTAKIENIVCSCSGNSVTVSTEQSVYCFDRIRLSDLELIVRLWKYCIDYKYFTKGSSEQYDKFLNLVKAKAPSDVLATILWVCSDFKESEIPKITEELEELIYE